MKRNLMLMIHTGSLGPRPKASRTVHVVGKFSTSSEQFVKRSKSFLALRSGKINGTTVSYRVVTIHSQVGEQLIMYHLSCIIIMYLNLYVPVVVVVAAQPNRPVNEPMVHHLHTFK